MLRYFITWCARIIDSDVVRLHPSAYEALMDPSVPRIGAQLSQFVNSTT